ncbi:cytochrome p450, partial [Trifolium pratense]
SNTTPSSHSWTKPPAGALKCNVDTACYIDQNFYGVGACIRDAQGRFVQAFTKKFDGKPEVAEAEAVGLLEAMRWIQNSHMPMVHIETDCLQVVHDIKTNSRNNTEFGNIIDMCRNSINLNQNCKVSYVRRQAN